MSDVHYVVYDSTTGAVARSGTCQDYDLQKQAGPGQGVMLATADCIIIAEVNLDPVKASAANQIDEASEAVRAQFITPGAGQAMTYLTKQAEAAAYLADNAAPTPFLTAEAAATSTTVAALAAVVHARAVAWQTIGAKIEAARMGAKAAVSAATNVGEVAAAMAIDWTTVTTA